MASVCAMYTRMQKLLIQTRCSYMCTHTHAYTYTQTIYMDYTQVNVYVHSVYKSVNKLCTVPTCMHSFYGEEGA